MIPEDILGADIRALNFNQMDTSLGEIAHLVNNCTKGSQLRLIIRLQMLNKVSPYSHTQKLFMKSEKKLQDLEK